MENQKLEELKKQVESCTKCGLCKTRTNTVFGVGDINAKIMFIGEGPGADEDRQGLPFVGKAGQLMDQAFIGLGIDRNQVYICNIVKCRPPNNRVPNQEEAKACIDYLRTQVLEIKPQIIVLLGNTALKNVLGENLGITSFRGKWTTIKGIDYIATFHPAALLRDESKKIDFWNDLQKVVDRLNEKERKI